MSEEKLYSLHGVIENGSFFSFEPATLKFQIA